MKSTGALGWPLVPSKVWSGETTLACPVCDSTDVLLTVKYPVRGTGPGGRGRLGDAGTAPVNACKACGYRTVKVQS